MKKTLLTILISGIIFTSIGATATYVYTARDIGYSPSDENWNVTNASEAISSLKTDLNTVNTNVTEYKQQITEALSEKGVEVDENSSMEDITTGIQSMSIEPTLITDSTTNSRNTSTTNSFSLSFVKDGIYVVMLSGDCKSNNWGNMSKGISGVTILKTTSVTNSNGNAGVNGGSTLWLVKATGTSGSVYLNSPDSDWVSGRVIVQRIM